MRPLNELHKRKKKYFYLHAGAQRAFHTRHVTDMRTKVSFRSVGMRQLTDCPFVYMDHMRASLSRRP